VSAFLKTVKFIIFVVGLFLVNYVGGVPTDARNLFITQTIFLAPYLVDFYPLLNIKSKLKWLIVIIWIAGILVFILNILGIVGVIVIEKVDETFMVMVNKQTVSLFSPEIPLKQYLLYIEVVYPLVFVGTITFEYFAALNKKMLEKKRGKKDGKGLTANVPS
jgi:hypothetical protein